MQTGKVWDEGVVYQEEDQPTGGSKDEWQKSAAEKPSPGRKLLQLYGSDTKGQVLVKSDVKKGHSKEQNTKVWARGCKDMLIPAASHRPSRVC